jgi:hypothetical protein
MAVNPDPVAGMFCTLAGVAAFKLAFIVAVKSDSV